MKRTMKNHKQKIRFITIGVLNTLVDFSILFALTWLGVPKVFANIVSTTAAFLTSFYANKKYTFQSDSTNIRHEMLRFVAFTLFSIWVIQSSVIALTTPLFEQLTNNSDLSLLCSKTIGITFGLVWNYITYSKFVFKNKHN